MRLFFVNSQQILVHSSAFRVQRSEFSVQRSMFSVLPKNRYQSIRQWCSEQRFDGYFYDVL